MLERGVAFLSGYADTRRSARKPSFRRRPDGTQGVTSFSAKQQLSVGISTGWASTLDVNGPANRNGLRSDGELEHWSMRVRQTN